jgi:Predicted permease
MSDVIAKFGEGFSNAFLMAYEVWWALVLGFAISGVVQAWIPRRRIEATLSGQGVRPIGWATCLGAASSSCSYAAIAIAKSLFQKGASAASALAFQFASTNLVWELGLVLWVLIGWQFTLAEFIGGLVLIVIMSGFLRLFVSPRLEEQARRQAQAAETGHQHHMASEEMRWRERLTSVSAWSEVAHNFRGDWQMLWKEITGGFLLAGFIGLLGNDFFNGLFVTGAPSALQTIENAACRLALVRGNLVRRRDRLHLRRPDRSPDHRHLPQVLRVGVRASDHRANARHDGDRRPSGRRAVQRRRLDPEYAPEPRRHLQLDRAQLQAGPELDWARCFLRSLLSDDSTWRHRSGLRNDGRPDEGVASRIRWQDLLFLF